MKIKTDSIAFITAYVGVTAFILFAFNAIAHNYLFALILSVIAAVCFGMFIGSKIGSSRKSKILYSVAIASAALSFCLLYADHVIWGTSALCPLTAVVFLACAHIAHYYNNAAIASENESTDIT